MEASGKTVALVETTGKSGIDPAGGNFPGTTPSDSVVKYNPDDTSLSTPSPGDAADGKNITTSCPPTVNLFHELVQAEHFAEGTAIDPTELLPYGENPYPNHPMRQEEARTIGCGKWTDEVPSENQLRSELGLPLREHIGANSKPASDGSDTTIRPGEDP
jgi:Effector protein